MAEQHVTSSEAQDDGQTKDWSSNHSSKGKDTGEFEVCLWAFLVK